MPHDSLFFNLQYNYHYSGTTDKILKNRLYHVNDSVPAASFSDDIDNQLNSGGVTYTFDNTATLVNTNNNYSYDAEGRLKKDLQEQIQNIVWRVDGKVAEVQRTSGSTRKNLKFDYDAMGNRIAKHQYTSAGVWEKSTYYVRDAQVKQFLGFALRKLRTADPDRSIGRNVLATYEKTQPVTPTMKVMERDMYGSSRLGTYNKQVEMVGASNPSTTVMSHEVGSKVFELSNHLGNVLAVFNNKKKPLDLGDYDFSGDGKNDSIVAQSGTPDGRIDFYVSYIVSSSDYSPFGVVLDGRNFSSTVYRYGYQSSEKDDELKDAGNNYTTYFRQLDPRISRWLSLDPKGFAYPSESPYSSMANNPILNNDVLGDIINKYSYGGDARPRERRQIRRDIRWERKHIAGFDAKFKQMKEEKGVLYVFENTNFLSNVEGTCFKDKVVEANAVGPSNYIELDDKVNYSGIRHVKLGYVRREIFNGNAKFDFSFNSNDFATIERESPNWNKEIDVKLKNDASKSLTLNIDLYSGFKAELYVNGKYQSTLFDVPQDLPADGIPANAEHHWSQTTIKIDFGTLNLNKINSIKIRVSANREGAAVHTSSYFMDRKIAKINGYTDK